LLAVCATDGGDDVTESWHRHLEQVDPAAMQSYDVEYELDVGESLWLVVWIAAGLALWLGVFLLARYLWSLA
jgi:hypothetical protein